MVSVGMLFCTVGLLTGCQRVVDTLSETVDGLVGDLLSSEEDAAAESKVSVRILTPTPTPEQLPELTPTPTPVPTATPTPKGMEPASEAVDEWVYATSSVNVRAGWSTEYFIVGGLAANDCVHRVAILENGWSKISYNSAYVYVNSAYLTKKTPSSVGTTHLDTMQYTYDAIFSGEDVVMLGVQNILQKPDLPACPEVTSLAIVLKYLGYSVDKVELADNFLTTTEPGLVSPMQAFWGDPKVAEGTYGCYAPVIVDAANKYFEAMGVTRHRAVDVSGSTLDELCDYVQRGTPVILWATTNLVATKYGSSWEIDGETFQWHSYEHCMVLMGYNRTKETVIVADPLRGIVEYRADRLEKRYQEQFSSALLIEAQ